MCVGVSEASSCKQCSGYLLYTAYCTLHSCSIRCTAAPYAVQLHHTLYSCTIRCTAAAYAVQMHHTLHSCTIRCTAAPYAVRLHHTLYGCTIRCTAAPCAVRLQHALYRSISIQLHRQANVASLCIYHAMCSMLLMDIVRS